MGKHQTIAKQLCEMMSEKRRIELENNKRAIMDTLEAGTSEASLEILLRTLHKDKAEKVGENMNLTRSVRHLLGSAYI